MSPSEPRYVELDLSRGVRLVGDRSAPEVALAAAELTDALGPPRDGAVEIVLAYGDGPAEGFRRRAARTRIELVGDSPRGVLCGTYAMLDELGVRWPWPGERPQLATSDRLKREEVADAPQLPGRCVILGERALLERADDWVTWAGRNRLNSIFVHVSMREHPIGAAPEALWLECRARVCELARARGMMIEHGGHVLPELLGRDAVRALAEGRMPSEDARRRLEHWMMMTHSEADVLHLWGTDVPPRAPSSSAASDAALRIANSVAGVAEDVRPGVQIAFLAYHNTEEVPSTVRPRANVCLLFAPRERCYEHALSDPACRRNSRYRELLLAHVEHFRAAGAAPARVFEYWFDAIRFAGTVPDLTETMAQDLAFYRAAGVHTVQMLMTGHGGTRIPHPNPPAFARLAWGGGL